MYQCNLYFGGTGEYLLFAIMLAILAGVCLAGGLIAAYFLRSNRDSLANKIARYVSYFGAILLTIAGLYSLISFLIPIGPFLCSIGDSIWLLLGPILLAAIGSILCARWRRKNATP